MNFFCMFIALQIKIIPCKMLCTGTRFAVLKKVTSNSEMAYLFSFFSLFDKQTLKDCFP